MLVVVLLHRSLGPPVTMRGATNLGPLPKTVLWVGPLAAVDFGALFDLRTYIYIYMFQAVNPPPLPPNPPPPLWGWGGVVGCWGAWVVGVWFGVGLGLVGWFRVGSGLVCGGFRGLGFGLI